MINDAFMKRELELPALMSKWFFFHRSHASPKKQCIGSFSRILAGGNSNAGSSSTNDKQLTRSYHEVTGDIICPSMVQGIDHLRDPRLNKVSFVEVFPSESVQSGIFRRA